MRRSKALKEAMISQQLAWALRRFSGKGAEQTSTCVLDDIVRREIKIAEKEKRAPNCQSRAIFDEVLSYFFFCFFYLIFLLTAKAIWICYWRS